MMKWTIVLAITFLFSTALNAAMESESEEIFLSPGETAIVRVYYPDQRTGNKTLISFEPQLLETNYAKGYHVMKVTQEDIDRLNAAGLRVKLDNTWTPAQPESQKGTDD